MMHLRSALLILLLPACISTTAKGGATSPVTTPNKPANRGKIVFQFERSGGFAGINERWTLFDDGNFISTTGETHAFARDEIINLVELIMSVDFNSLQITPDPFSSCADCFRYKLVVTKGSSVIELVWSDGDEATPKWLIQILENINALIFKATQN